MYIRCRYLCIRKKHCLFFSSVGKFKTSIMLIILFIFRQISEQTKRMKPIIVAMNWSIKNSSFIKYRIKKVPTKMMMMSMEKRMKNLLTSIIHLPFRKLYYYYFIKFFHKFTHLLFNIINSKIYEMNN